MARINTQDMTNWQDEDVLHASDYCRERDTIVTAVNDIVSDIGGMPDTTYVDQKVEANRVGDHAGTWQGLTPSEISIGLGIKPEDIGAVSKIEFDALAQQVNNITSANTQLNDYPRLPDETDDKGRIQRAIEATPVGGALHIPEGYYIADNILITKPMTINMEGAGVIESITPNQDIFIAKGTESTNSHKLTTSLARGVQTFTIDSTPADIASGDMIVLRDDAVRASDNQPDVNIEVHEVLGWQSTESNLILGSEMNVDTDADGIVDNFTKIVNGSITSTFICDSVEQAQKIDVSAGSAGAYAGIYQEFNVTAGKYYNFSAQLKASGTIFGRVYLEWYNGASPTGIFSEYGVLDGSVDGGTYKTLEYVNQLAPATATKARLNIQAWTQAGTETGIIWAKNAVAKSSQVSVTLRDYVRYPKNVATTTSINVYKMNPIEGLTFNGIGLRHKEGSTSGRGIFVDGVRGLYINHLRAFRGAGSTVQACRTIYAIVDGFNIVQPQVTGSGQGYGIQFYGGALGVIVRNGFTSGTRHSVDFDSTAEAYVYDVVDQNGMGASFMGSHNGRGADIAFFRCKALNTMGHGFSFDSQGYADPLSCTFVAFTIKDCEVITQNSGVDGVHFYSPAKQVTVDGFKMRYKSGAEGGYSSLGNSGIRLYPAQTESLLVNCDVSGVRRAYSLFGTGQSQTNDGSRIVLRDSVARNCDSFFLVNSGTDRRLQVYNCEGYNVAGRIFELAGTGSFQELVVDGFGLWNSLSAFFYTGTFTAGTNGCKGVIQNIRTDRSGIVSVSAGSNLSDTPLYLLGNGQSVLLNASGAVTIGTLANGLVEGHTLSVTNNNSTNAITIPSNSNLALQGSSIVLNTSLPSVLLVWRNGKWYQT